MKILILGALEKEISFLVEMINAKKKDDFCITKINQNEVYLGITGVGTLNAFNRTTSFLERIHPDTVINIGTAGGHTLDVLDGEIVVCDEAIYHGGYIIDKTPTPQWNMIDETQLSLKGDERLSHLLNKFDQKVKIHHGKTLSGDFFTKDQDVIVSLNKKYHHLCEDMETIAIYQVCQEKKIPVIAYRIISNNELRGTSYQDNVLKVNQKLQSIIAKLLNSFDLD